MPTNELRKGNDPNGGVEVVISCNKKFPNYLKHAPTKCSGLKKGHSGAFQPHAQLFQHLRRRIVVRWQYIWPLGPMVSKKKPGA